MFQHLIRETASSVSPGSVAVVRRCLILAGIGRKLIRRNGADIDIDIEGDIDIVSVQTLDETHGHGSQGFSALQSAQTAQRETDVRL